MSFYLDPTTKTRIQSPCPEATLDPNQLLQDVASVQNPHGCEAPNPAHGLGPAPGLRTLGTWTATIDHPRSGRDPELEPRSRFLQEAEVFGFVSQQDGSLEKEFCF